MDNLPACNYQHDFTDQILPGSMEILYSRNSQQVSSDDANDAGLDVSDSDNSSYSEHSSVAYRSSDSVVNSYSDDSTDSDDDSYSGPDSVVNSYSGDSTDSDDDSYSDPDSDSKALLKKKSLSNRLLLAVKNGEKDIVNSLLDKNFNTSYIFVKSWNSDSQPERKKNKYEIWRDAMYIAMEKDTKHSAEIIELLLDCDTIWSLEAKMRVFILHRLIRNKKKVADKVLRLIEILLKSGTINVNRKDRFGRTVLHLAAAEKLTSLFIRYGADVNKKDKKGRTPLMHMMKRISVLQSILKEARTLVDLDAIDCYGQTALMIATKDAQPDVVELLLNAGASVNLSDHLGFTALHHVLLVIFDHLDFDLFSRNSKELKKGKEIFTILFDAKDEGCNFYMRNKKWIAKCIKIVEMLLGKRDIDMNALSFDKFSPLDLAEGLIPQLPSSIKNALKEKGAVLNVFQQTETQSTSDFQLDVRCRLSLQRLFCQACDKHERYLHVGLLKIRLGLLKMRLLTLIETFQAKILSGKDQHGRNALHLVAISFSLMCAVYNSSFIGNEKSENRLRDLANTIVNKLISIGCNVNETDIYGRTPMHYANFILKDTPIFYEDHAPIKEKSGNSVIDDTPQQSTNSSVKDKAVIGRNYETYFLLMNNKQMDIEFQCVDYQDRAAGDRDSFRTEVDPKTDPGLLWENSEYAFHHPLVKQITKEVTDFVSAIANEIERLDPRFEIKIKFVGSSNEGTKIGKPDEFDFCFVLTKISELCEVSQSPELPTGFVHLKRKLTKVVETSDFDCLFEDDEMLSTEKLNCQFCLILNSALVNVEGQQNFESNVVFTIRKMCDTIKKASNIEMMKLLDFYPDDYISIDIVPCIHVDGWWPDEAISNVIDEIKKFGCNLIFDRPQKLYPWVPYSESCARISFAKAESDMIKHSWGNAREAYMIGKTMIQTSKLRSGYTKYVLKNSLLYCIEALTPTSEKASQLGLNLEELISKFHQIDRYLWLRCLMECLLEFAAQDFCPCYFLPNFSSPIQNTNLKKHSPDWMTESDFYFPKLCIEAYNLYRCTSDNVSKLFCQLPAPDPLWERFDRNQLITRIFKIAYE